ncbi:MAG: hypothetical protein BAJALOKI1v1_2190001 [Promethearchaeota archaeon]|nr:MAG: hypothetical protein BAJALOKI1v1_2190001 [Candidatus Lokiarchaeota archaeon]
MVNMKIQKPHDLKQLEATIDKSYQAQQGKDTQSDLKQKPSRVEKINPPNIPERMDPQFAEEMDKMSAIEEFVDSFMFDNLLELFPELEALRSRFDAFVLEASKRYKLDFLEKAKQNREASETKQDAEIGRNILVSGLLTYREKALSDSELPTYTFRKSFDPPDIAIKEIQIDPTLTVKDIKKIVHEKYDIHPILGIHFVLNGKYIPNHVRFSELRIRSGKDIITVITTQAAAGYSTKPTPGITAQEFYNKIVNIILSFESGCRYEGNGKFSDKPQSGIARHRLYNYVRKVLIHDAHFGTVARFGKFVIFGQLDLSGTPTKVTLKLDNNQLAELINAITKPRSFRKALIKMENGDTQTVTLGTLQKIWETTEAYYLDYDVSGNQEWEDLQNDLADYIDAMMSITFNIYNPILDTRRINAFQNEAFQFIQGFRILVRDFERDIINYLDYPPNEENLEDLKKIIRYPNDPIHEYIEFKDGAYRFERDASGELSVKVLNSLLGRDNRKNYWDQLTAYQSGAVRNIKYTTFEVANIYLHSHFWEISDLYEGFLEIAKVTSVFATSIVKEQLAHFIESRGKRLMKYENILDDGTLYGHGFKKTREFLTGALFEIFMTYRGNDLLAYLGLDINDHQEFARMVDDYQNNLRNNPERFNAFLSVLYNLLFGGWKLTYTDIEYLAEIVSLELMSSFVQWTRQLIDTNINSNNPPSVQNIMVVCENGHQNERSIHSLERHLGCPDCNVRWINEKITGEILHEIYGLDMGSYRQIILVMNFN